MSELHDRAKSDENAHSLSEESFVVGETIEHLACTLGVADIGKLLLAGDLESIINLSGNIEVSHDLKIVVPPIIVRNGALMALRVLVSSGVAEPNIISSSSSD